MIVDRRLLALVVAVYVLALSTVYPFSPPDTGNTIYAFQDLPAGAKVGFPWVGAGYAVVVARGPETLIVWPDGSSTLVKGLTPIVACASRGTVVVAGVRTGDSARVIAGISRDRMEWSYTLKTLGNPVLCSSSNGRVAVVFENPIASDMLVVVDTNNNTGLTYRLPRQLFYASMLYLENNTVLMGGSGWYAVLNQSANGTLQGVKYSLDTGNLTFRITGALDVEGRLLLYGKLMSGGITGLKLVGAVYLPSLSEAVVFPGDKRNTDVRGAVLAGGSVQILVEYSGEKIDTVSIDPEKGSVSGATKIVFLAPYVFESATRGPGALGVAATLYTGRAVNYTCILSIRTPAVEVLGANYSLALAALQDDGVPSHHNMGVRETPRSVGPLNPRSLRMEENPKFNVERGERFHTVAYGPLRDRPIMFCSALSVFTALVAIPVYAGVSRSRPYKWE